MRTLIENVDREFLNRFGAKPDFYSQAPGRINIIGEHTDYTGGVSLPAAIDLTTVAGWRRRDDNKLKIYSTNMQAGWETSWPELEAGIDSGWKKYVAGALLVFREKFQASGLELVLSGDVPLGKGVSSSASVELSVLNGLNAIFEARISGVDLCLMAQQVEHRFLKVKSGLLDQFASQFGQENAALLVDFQTLKTQIAPAGPGIAAYSWMLADSMVKRELASSKYSERVAEYQAILKTAVDAGFKTLRDLNSGHVSELYGRGPRNLLRRARHIVSENERTFKAAEVLREGDAAALGALLTLTHLSLAEDYEVSHPNLDFLVATGIKLEGVRGGRMMGGGFGGCAIFLVETAQVPAVARELAAAYRDFSKENTEPWAVRFAAGASAWKAK